VSCAVSCSGHASLNKPTGSTHTRAHTRTSGCFKRIFRNVRIRVQRNAIAKREETTAKTISFYLSIKSILQMSTLKFKQNSRNEKKRSERRKHCALAVLTGRQKKSHRRRPPSRGRRTAKMKSAGDGHYLYLQTQFGENRCMQFRVIVVTDPEHTNTQTTPDRPLQTQTGPITTHCAAKLSAQGNESDLESRLWDILK